MKSGDRKKGKPGRKPVARRMRSPKAISKLGISPSPPSSLSIQPEDVSLTGMLEKLKPHAHLCLIYESQKEWRAVAVPFISLGLKHGEKCTYVVDTSTADEIRKYLAEEGIDVAAAEKSGQLSILHETEAYTKEGSFDPDKMIALLISETEKAIADGYPALRVTGEMTWVLRGHPGSERVLEYEAKLNRDLFPKYPCLAICQYDRWKFDPEVIKGVIMTHPLLVQDDRIYRNFYYIEPEEFLNRKRAELEVQHWLNNVERERQIQETLRQSEEKYRTFTEQSLQGLAVVQDFHIVFANAAFAEISGYSVEELLSLPPAKVQAMIHPEDQALVWGRFKDRLAGKTVSPRYEYRGIRKDQTVRWLEMHASRIEYGGKPAILGAVIDITERKRAAEELEKAVEELQHSNAELERFAYVASHDLQEPLRMVSSYMQLLERRYKDKLDADANDFINYAMGGAERMQQLLNDLLTYSRVGTRAKPFKHTDMEAVLEAALANLQVAIKESKARVTHDPLPTLLADEGQMVQVLQNLIGNALKFRSEKSPHIHVSAEPRDSEWVFSVKDNGIGIEPQHFDRIFLIFQRLHREEYPGTGTGLAIAQKIVERHGGRMWVESRPGKGSTFYFSIQTAGERQKAEGGSEL
jgi:chemotaxis family two-component system sensor kinase Cph1